jgi:peptide subunit release factor 1 (eRF1)
MDLQALIDRLAKFPPGDHPFVSVYLDARPDQIGREKYHAFVRTELKARAGTYPDHSPARTSIEADIERITTWLEREVRHQANGIAVFTCAAAGVFEGVQLEAPIEHSEVFVGPGPHLYPLAAVADRYRRHAAVVLDTHSARIFVFALGEVMAETAVETETIPRSEAGGWSQARYQRHADEFQRQHARDVAQALERLVREERVDCIVVAANDVARPLLRAELPKDLAQRVVEVDELDVHSSRDQILRRSLEVARAQDARDDADRVRRMLDAYRAGGLGVVGVDATLRALASGQVHELLIGAEPAILRAGDGRPVAEVADELIAKARQTDARVTFIEDSRLLADAGGVGGLLRFRTRSAA